MGLKVIVVGGGASGLIAAGFAAQNGHEVTVIERNPRMARKILVTGKGRCNVTNNCSVQTCVDNIPLRRPVFIQRLNRLYAPRYHGSAGTAGRTAKNRTG